MNGGVGARYLPAWTWILLGVLTLFMFFSGLSSSPFIDRDEGEYATVAQGMIERSDYVIPHVNGRAYYEKPALYFWLMAGSFKAFGWNEAAARLPSAISGVLLVILAVWFGYRRQDATLGFIAGIMIVTSVINVLLARVAIMDMLLTLLTTATLVFFYEGYLSDSKKGRWFFIAAWASMGLAFLTKGPIGALIPLITVFFYTIANWNLWSAVKKARFPEGLLVFAIVAGPWYVLAFLREGRNFWEGFFISQNVGRFTDVVLGHGAPLWFYIPVLVVLVWPWAVFGLPTMYNAVKKSNRHIRRVDRDADLDMFLTCWCLSSLFLLSLAATKQPNYVMPVVPALVLLAARWWRRRLFDSGNASRGLWPLLGFTAFIGVAVAVFLTVVGGLAETALESANAGINPDSFEYAFQETAPQLGAAPIIVGLLMITAAGAAIYMVRKRRFWMSFMALALGGMVFSAGLMNYVVPGVLDYLQAPAREISFKVRDIIGDDDDLASYGLYKPTMWYYTGRNILRIKSDEKQRLTEYLNQEKRGLLLSRVRFLKDLEQIPNFRLLEKEGGYILGDNKGGDNQ